MFFFSKNARVRLGTIIRARRLLKELARGIFARAGIDEAKTIGIRFVDKNESKRLNRTFRNKPNPTDVLSWENDGAGFEDVADDADMLGEIAVCVEICAEQGETNGWDFETECVRLVVHGIAHITGRDHATPETEADMLAFEQSVLKAIGFDQIYTA